MHATLQTTLEDLIGRGTGPAIEVDIDAIVIPGEPAVMYDRNGTGYPGSPPEAEFDAATATEIVGYMLGGMSYQWKRSQRADWFELLDRIIARHIENHWDDFVDDVFEAASDKMEMCDD